MELCRLERLCVLARQVAWRDAPLKAPARALYVLHLSTGPAYLLASTSVVAQVTGSCASRGHVIELSSARLSSARPLQVVSSDLL